MPNNHGKNRSGLYHPGYGTPEVAQKFEERVLLFLLDGIWSVLIEALCGLFRAKAFPVALEVLENLFNVFAAGITDAVMT
jgi:hypothetical protein